MEYGETTPTLDSPVSSSAHNLSGEAAFSRSLLDAMLLLKQGDFSVRMPSDLNGVNGKIADAFNDIALVSERRARETSRVTHAVGKAGKLKQRMNISGLSGGWAAEVDAINTLIDDLVWP